MAATFLIILLIIISRQYDRIGTVTRRQDSPFI